MSSWTCRHSHRRTAHPLMWMAVLVVAIGSTSAQDEDAPEPWGLRECIDAALRNNPDILSSEQGIVMARAAVKRSRSSYYPQLSLDGSGGLGQGSVDAFLGGAGFNAAAPLVRTDASLSATITLWRTGRREQVDERQAELASTEMQHINRLLQLAEQVAIDYYAALAAEELVAVADAGVAASQGHLRDVETRIRIGSAAGVDIYAVEDDVARSELDQIDAQSGTRSTLAALRFTMGLPAGTELQIAPVDAEPDEATPTLESALEIAAARRPDVLAARETIRARDFALEQADKARGPTIDVTSGYTYSYSNWRSRNPSWDLLMARASWPLFDGRASEADEISARAAVSRAQADLRRLLNQVGLEVELALIDIERAAERVKATARSVAAADARLRAAESKYREDVGILLEVTDARAAATQAAADQVRARFDHQVALVALQRAMGALPIPDQSPSAVVETTDD